MRAALLCSPLRPPLFALCLASVASVAHAAPEVWDFTALLDGDPIGTHRFTVDASANNEQRSVTSEARFDVRFLGLTAYRYRHSVQEQWRGNCLASMTARTDDDGTVTVVNGEAAASGFKAEARTEDGKGRLKGTPTQASANGCLMSFAYWSPALRTQQRLLDPGTGRVENVTISPLPQQTLDVRGSQVPVQGWRIAGLKHPIDVWYAGERWVGLDTTVDRGRKLTYRLR